MKRFVSRLCGLAEPLTAIAESLIFAAFITTMLLSFYGALGNPWFYAGCWLACTLMFLYATRTSALSPMQHAADGPKFYTYTITGLVCGLVFLACFMSPDSADEQRTKLVRMILAIDSGSAWETSRIDSLSVMYFFPASYYTVFTALEALRVPTFAYSLVNALLVIGSLLNLWLLFGADRSVKHLFWVTLFIAAPQFLFSGLGGHEEALTLFLSTRAAVWLILRPIDFRTILFFLLCCVLAVSVKLTTLIFLPCALLILLLYFGGTGRLKQWVHPKVWWLALVALVPVGLLVFLPDAMTNANHGISFADQMKRLSAYHKASDIGCVAAHFYLRLFELGFDFVKNLISFFRFNILPDVDFHFLPFRCAHDSTRFSGYFIPDAMIRENTQFGLLPVLTLASFFMVREKKRILAAASWGLFLLATAVYSAKLMYWSGTGRYFIIGLLILLPAFLLFMEALEEKTNFRFQRFVAWLLLLPACFLFFSSADNIPRRILRGDRSTYLAGEIVPSLRTVEGKTNIYFNDLMSFYTLLRLIPSHEVTLKKEIIPGVTNIISLPRIFSSRANWHDNYYIFPVPAPQGEYVYMGNPRSTFGNKVPTSFYMGTPGTPARTTPAFEMHRYDPKANMLQWAKSIGKLYDYVPGDGKSLHFIYSKAGEPGLCIVRSDDNTMAWTIESYAACRSENGF